MSDYKVPQPNMIQNFFSNIAPRYDFLNTVLSLNKDKRWRQTAVRESVQVGDKSILDIGTGSGELIKTYLENHLFEKALGIDFCEPMLELARKRLTLYPQAEFQNVNILEMEPSSLKYDIISTSFVLRSIADHLEDFFGKCFSLLNSGGRLVILELTRPESFWVRFLFFPYVKFYLPIVGRFLTREKTAYQFLSKSVINFKTRAEIVGLLKRVGFKNVKLTLLSAGIGTLFVAKK